MPRDMASVIVPKSDQLNADDLLAGPITIKVASVTVKGGQEQPVSIHYEGDNGKPYKPCKSMCRVLVSAWGADSSKYVGRSMTLYCDPKVKWAGMEVGGIRISHLSDIESQMTMALTVTRANRKPYTVKPLTDSAAPASHAGAPPSSPSQQPEAADPEQLRKEFAACDSGAEKAFLKVAKLESLDDLDSADYEDARQWIERRRQKLNAQAGI